METSPDLLKQRQSLAQKKSAEPIPSDPGVRRESLQGRCSYPLRNPPLISLKSNEDPRKPSCCKPKVDLHAQDVEEEKMIFQDHERHHEDAKKARMKTIGRAGKSRFRWARRQTNRLRDSPLEQPRHVFWLYIYRKRGTEDEGGVLHFLFSNTRFLRQC